MRAIHGTAIYTGGGCYSVIGELDDGRWFNGCMDWCEILDTDVRTVDENGDLMCFYNEWLDKHRITGIEPGTVWKMLEDFCDRLDSGEEGLTDGYGKFSNYCAGEVKMMLDIPHVD